LQSRRETEPFYRSGDPSNEELLRAYEGAGGPSVRDLEWFAALTRYKQLAITALLVRNARRRGETTTMIESMVALVASARALLGLT
jgi:aminoglycoside phosphotransferase (APT) family kinase protein